MTAAEQIEAARIAAAELNLTGPQRRILADVRAAGSKVYNGRAFKPLEALEARGLVEVDWDIVPAHNQHGLSTMWRLTVTPRRPW